MKHNYLQYLKRRANSGNWFLFFRDYLEVMPHISAITLQSIMNYSKKKLKGEWIRCPREYLEKYLKLSEDKQVRILKELKDKGYIEVKMIGIPARRYIKIDLLKIESDISDSLKSSTAPRGLESAIPRGRKFAAPAKRKFAASIDKNNLTDYSSLSKNTKYKNTSRSIERDGIKFISNPQEKKTWSKKIALRTYQQLKICKKIMRIPSLGKWEGEFDKLKNEIIERDNVSEKEAQRHIKKVIENYLSRLKNKNTYLKLYSAASLRKNFVFIEDLLNTNKSNVPSNNEHSDTEQKVIEKRKGKLIIRKLKYPERYFTE